MFESHLNHITFESYLNHESSQERRRRSWNAEWQKNRLFAYCQQHIFWLIGLAFLHIHSTVFFTHITNFLDQLKRASRAERLVQCQRSKLPIAVDFCTQSCPSFWKNCKKNLTRTRKNLVFEEKSSKRRTKSTHNGISYMQEEGRHLDQDEILVTCCYWHVPGQKILGLTQAKKKGKENRKTWTTWGFFFKEVLKDQWRFLSPWVTYLLWILLQWISASLVGWTSTGLNVK